MQYKTRAYPGAGAGKDSASVLENDNNYVIEEETESEMSDGSSIDSDAAENKMVPSRDQDVGSDTSAKGGYRNPPHDIELPDGTHLAFEIIERG